MIWSLLLSRWGLLIILVGGFYAWHNGAGDALDRAFPGIGQNLVDRLLAFGSWLIVLALVPWDKLSEQVPQPLLGSWMRSAWGHWFVAALIFIVLTTMLRYRSEQSRLPGREERKKNQTSRPGRIPFIDRPKRVLPIGRDGQGRQVVANIAQSNMLITAGTGSGKSAIMRHLADADEAVCFGLFDISLPSIARFRYWQEQSRQGKLLDENGNPRPVIIWRPNPHNVPGWPCLQLTNGPALEAVSRVMHAFKESAGSTGDQKAKARDVGVWIYEEADRNKQVRCLDMLIEGWRAAAVNPKYDREVRTACWRWASKVSGMKAMLGSAEGPNGLNPLDIAKRRGKLAMEVNNFSVAEAAAAFGPLIVGIFIWLVDASPVPITVGFDEGNQLGDRVEDLDKIYTACRGRDGRACLCCQKPLKFKEIAPNADVVVIGGYGPGAYAERDWAARVTGLEPDDFKKHERNWYGRIARRIGRLEGLMNLECYVSHEGVTEGPVHIENPGPEMKRYLRLVDWPKNRAEIPVPPGILEPDPNEPDDFPPQPDGSGSNGSRPRSIRGTAATQKTAHEKSDQKRATEPVQTGSIHKSTNSETSEEQRDGTISVLHSGKPEAWVKSEDAKRWWQSLSGTAEPGSSGALWLWIGTKSTSNGRPKSSRNVSDEELAKLRETNVNARRSQSVMVYPELYVEAGCPNGKPFPGCSYDHLSHGRDETCPGGIECFHILDCNPWNIQPVTAKVQAERRDAQRALHNEWRMKQGLPPLEDPIAKATQAKLDKEIELAV